MPREKQFASGVILQHFSAERLLCFILCSHLNAVIRHNGRRQKKAGIKFSIPTAKSPAAILGISDSQCMFASLSVLKTAGLLVIVVPFPFLVFYECCFCNLKPYVITFRHAIAFFFSCYVFPHLMVGDKWDLSHFPSGDTALAFRVPKNAQQLHNTVL